MYRSRLLRDVAAHARASEPARLFVLGALSSLLAGFVAHTFYHQPVGWSVILLSLTTGYGGLLLGSYAWHYITDTTAPTRHRTTRR